MTQLLLQVPEDRAHSWVDALAEHMPALEVSVWPDRPAGASCQFALLWQPPAAVFDAMSDVEVFFSLGAGVDHLMPYLDRIGDRPVVRMVDPTLAEGMTEYVLYYVLKFHRALHSYADQQAQRQWAVLPQVSARDRRVGILGLGAIGGHIAKALTALGFAVHGYSRSGTDIDKIVSHSGEAGLQSLIEQVDILVNVLPLTQETQELLNAAFFSQMKKGAYVINIGRGAHVVEQDLIDAVQTGQLAGAALDVFQTEPLPQASPLWDVPGVHITPHMASLTLPHTAARHVVSNIAAHLDGRKLWPVFENERGY